MNITIEAEDVSGKMFLRNAIAEAKMENGTEIDITSVIPDGSLHFRIGDKSYLVKMRDVLDAILEGMEK